MVVKERVVGSRRAWASFAGGAGMVVAGLGTWGTVAALRPPGSSVYLFVGLGAAVVGGLLAIAALSRAFAATPTHYLRWGIAGLALGGASASAQFFVGAGPSEYAWSAAVFLAGVWSIGIYVLRRPRSTAGAGA
jgi:hypothetical protein